MQLNQVQSERERVEKEYLKARRDAESDDYLDKWASETAVDDASTTSDYSTTSSRGMPTERLLVKAGYHMTVSCNGALPPAQSGAATGLAACSDYSSSAGASPQARPAAPAAVRAFTGESSGGAWYEAIDDTPSIAPDDTEAEFTAAAPASKAAIASPEQDEDTPTNGSCSAAPVKFSPRTLTPEEKPFHRLSQKMRLRSNRRAEQRDPRRHTLSDLEQVRSAIDLLRRRSSVGEATPGGQSDKQSPKRKASARFKSWLKQSFRKSSPELRTASSLRQQQ